MMAKPAQEDSATHFNLSQEILILNALSASWVDKTLERSVNTGRRLNSDHVTQGEKERRNKFYQIANLQFELCEDGHLAFDWTQQIGSQYCHCSLVSLLFMPGLIYLLLWADQDGFSSMHIKLPSFQCLALGWDVRRSAGSRTRNREHEHQEE